MNVKTNLGDELVSCINNDGIQQMEPLDLSVNIDAVVNFTIGDENQDTVSANLIIDDINGVLCLLSVVAAPTIGDIIFYKLCDDLDKDEWFHLFDLVTTSPANNVARVFTFLEHEG